MKAGDLVRGAYDKNKYRTGVILRIVRSTPLYVQGETPFCVGGGCVEVLWNTTPVGLSQRGMAWGRDLEVISEAR